MEMVIMTNKIDIKKLEVKEYKKGSYLNIKYIYKGDNFRTELKKKLIANEHIKIDQSFVDDMLKDAETSRINHIVELVNNSQLSRIRINGYTLWAV